MNVRSQNLWLTPEMTRAMHATAETPEEREIMSRFWLAGMNQSQFNALAVHEATLVIGLIVRTTARLREEAGS